MTGSTPTPTQVVVVVEDDHVFRNLLTEVLEGLGFDVFAYERAEALSMRLLHEMRPAMAVVDLNLPGVKGDEMCEMLSTARTAYGTRILLMSNLDEATLARRAAAARADGHTTKRTLILDPAAALRGLVPPPLVEAELVDEPSKTTNPETVVGLATRRHLANFRHRVEVRVFSRFGAQVHTPRGATFAATATDLSFAGTRLSLPQPLDADAVHVGDRLEVRLELDRGSPLTVNARVAWMNRRGPHLIGLAFDMLAMDARDRIEAHLQKALDELLASGGFAKA